MDKSRVTEQEQQSFDGQLDITMTSRQEDVPPSVICFGKFANCVRPPVTEGLTCNAMADCNCTANSHGGCWNFCNWGTELGWVLTSWLMLEEIMVRRELSSRGRQCTTVKQVVEERVRSGFWWKWTVRNWVLDKNSTTSCRTEEGSVKIEERMMRERNPYQRQTVRGTLFFTSSSSDKHNERFC